MLPSSPWCHWLLVSNQQHFSDGTKSIFSAKNHLFSGGNGTGTSCHLVCGNGLCVRALDRDSSSHIQRPKTDLLVKRWLHRVLMHWGKVSCKLDSITVIDKGSWWTSQLGFLNTHRQVYNCNVMTEITNSSTNTSPHKNTKHNNCFSAGICNTILTDGPLPALCLEENSSAQGYRWMRIYSNERLEMSISPPYMLAVLLK